MATPRASSTSSILHWRAPSATVPRCTSAASYPLKISSNSRSRQAQPRTDKQYPAYIQYRIIPVDGAYIIEPPPVERQQKARRTCQGGAPSLNTFKTSMPITPTPALSDSPTLASSEAMRHQEPQRIHSHRRLPAEAAHPR